MNWITNFLTSSIGKKIIMGLSGLFLCLFVTIHMAGNMTLLFDATGCMFNEYTYGMVNSPLIKVVSYFTYFMILLHAVQGILLARQNKAARANGYAYSTMGKSSSWASRNMAILGLILLVFLIIHLKSFWFEMKFGSIPYTNCGGTEYKDLYTIVKASFEQWWYVLIYLVSLGALSFHLWHGFQSGFQSLGLNHDKYTPIIKTIGWIFAIIIPIGFATQPLFFLINSFIQ